jgi:hypothetical protein
LALATVYLFFKAPSSMVLIGGVGTAALLVIVMVGAVDFRYRRGAAELTPGRAYDAALWLSIAAITAFLIYNSASVIAPWLKTPMR